MKKTLPYLPAAIIILFLVAAAATTIDDFFLPGSQIGQSGNIETPDRCDNCHGGYDQTIEPAFNWRGSMMAQAARDPLFYACLAIANQDAPGVGDMCLRCHTPDGWLNGRCVPTDGSALNNNDRQGVQCDFCHKMVKPSELGVNPYPNDVNYKSTVYGVIAYDQDQQYLGRIIPLPGTSANGMYIADANNAKRGPFTDATGRHQMIYSPFHRDAAHCGTCHDVSNPVFTRTTEESLLKYSVNSMGVQSETFNLRQMFPIERTYSEWQASGYNAANGIDGVPDMICQDCHMKDVSGRAASMKDARFRTDMPLHDLTGGNTFAPLMIKDKWAAEVNAAALDAGIARARAQLKAATTMELTVSGTTATVKVINNTGHKFPTGYPEGRRVWINLVAYDANNNVIYESGQYSYNNAEIVDPNHSAKIYHCEPGISKRLSFAVKGDYSLAGPSYHMALNDTVYFDNRIPPAGYTNAKLNEYQSPVIGTTYSDGQNYDVTTYTLPSTPARVEAKLYYQTTTKSFVTFLRDENVTNTAGTELYALWEKYGKSAPELINSATFGGLPIPTLDARFNTVVSKIVNAKTGTYATTTILVTSGGVAVTGATISASYSGPTSGTIIASTNTSGIATLNSKAIKNPLTTWCFTINNVTKTGYEYILPKPLTRLCEGDVLKSALISEGILAATTLEVYPNPTAGKIRISYSLEVAEKARIAIFNSAGQQVNLLSDKLMPEGKHLLEWDGSGYPDGVYFCRMVAGDKILSKTILLKK